MPAIRPSGKKQIVPSDPATAGTRRGSRRHSELINVKGIPRYDDLLTTRLLEQTPTVSLPMNTATKQARAIPWDIQPTVDNPTATHNMMADRIYEFVDGGFNANGQTWDQLLGLVLNDSISIDTGAIEFVPTDTRIEHPQTGERTYWLSEVYAVDGTIVSKNLDEHDKIPEPPEPAYFKWGNTPNVNAGIFDSGLYDSSWFDRFQTSRLLSGVRQRAVPMTRDEMAVLETNSQPRELSAYGRGVVQQVRPWAEILLNQDRANVRHFAEDEYAKGILNIGEQYQGEIDRFREYWKDDVQGKTDTKLPIVASNDTEFIPFQETLKELQYLESQNWYSKLVWLLFGESTSTVGLAEDANTATAEAQSEDVMYNTTLPRMNALAEWMNNEWLPKMREYWIADGELAFVIKPEEHPILAEREREKRRDDLNNALRTPNEVRTAEDREPLPWGDMPSEAVSAFAREHPEWVAENWGGIEDAPDPASEGGGLFSHTPRDTDDSAKSATTKDATNDDESGFTADVFRIVADDDHEFDTGTVMAIGVDFPNSDVYVDWKIEEWPDESQLSGAHVSIYATIEDAQSVAQGEIQMLDSLDADAAKAVADTITSKAVEGNATRRAAPDPSETGNTSETSSGRIGTNQAALSETRDSGTGKTHVAGGLTLSEALDNPADAKDALRNERDGDLPDLTHVVDAGTEALGAVISEAFEQLAPALEQRWPDDPPDEKAAETKRLAIDLDSIVDQLNIQRELTAATGDMIREAMEEGAETEKADLVSELEDRFDDPDANIIAAFDVEDTAAYERMIESAADDMVTVEDTIKDKVRNTLVNVAEDRGGVQEATDRLRDEVDELSDSHARLVARTETLDASRHGSQALAESADAIGGKRWRASNDNRTRWWHEAMDGVVVEVDDDFTVPTDGDESGVGKDRDLPSGFPRKAFVVGDSDPYNCRCVEQTVLAEDIPDDATEARDYDGLEVRFTDAHRGDAVFALEYDLSERQFEVREEARESPGETFADVWTRVRADRSKSGIVDDLGMSKTTVGKWDAQVGL